MADISVLEEAPVVVEIPPLVAKPPLGRLQVDSKLGAGAFASALGILTVWLLNSSGVEVPPEPAIAIGTVYMGVLGYIAKS